MKNTTKKIIKVYEVEGGNYTDNIYVGTIEIEKKDNNQIHFKRYWDNMDCVHTPDRYRKVDWVNTEDPSDKWVKDDDVFGQIVWNKERGYYMNEKIYGRVVNE